MKLALMMEIAAIDSSSMKEMNLVAMMVMYTILIIVIKLALMMSIE